MSLLLEALRRAEQDSRKRKQAAAAASAPAPASLPGKPGPVAPREVPDAELTLEEQTPTAFPEITLVADEVPVGPSEEELAPISPAARPAIPSYGRYAKSSPLVAAQAGTQDETTMGLDAATSGPGALSTMASVEAAPQLERGLLSPPAHEAGTARLAASRSADGASAGPPQERGQVSVPIPATTPRQAISAAGVMAGSPQRKSLSKEQRRKLWLVVVAGAVALPVAAFLLFGDAFFGSSSTLLVSTTPRQAESLPASSPAVSLSDAYVPGGGPAEVSATPSVPASAGGTPAATPTTTALAAPSALVVPSTAAALLPVAAREAARSLDSRPALRTRAAAAPASHDAARRQAPGGTDNRSVAAAATKPAGLSLLAGAAKPASLMDAAYAAYQAGKPDEAAQLYREVLKRDPAQRDAWLGLAVIAHASNQREPAMDAYKRVLRLEPQNATALAGVSSLSSNAGEPRQESRLRELLARSPQEAELNHALGLVLSGEQRWSEAQPLFFKAHALAPQEPQFAYNLAVTLDHLRKSSLAAQYYDIALGLAQGKTPGFDESNARSRVAALKAGSVERSSR